MLMPAVKALDGSAPPGDSQLASRLAIGASVTGPPPGCLCPSAAGSALDEELVRNGLARIYGTRTIL